MLKNTFISIIGINGLWNKSVIRKYVSFLYTSKWYNFSHKNEPLLKAVDSITHFSLCGKHPFM